MYKALWKWAEARVSIRQSVAYTIIILQTKKSEELLPSANGK
jgi:hypothetical protein